MDTLRIHLFAPLIFLYNFPTFPFASSTFVQHLTFFQSLTLSTATRSFRSLTLHPAVSILLFSSLTHYSFNTFLHTTFSFPHQSTSIRKDEDLIPDRRFHHCPCSPQPCRRSRCRCGREDCICDAHRRRSDTHACSNAQCAAGRVCASSDSQRSYSSSVGHHSSQHKSSITYYLHPLYHNTSYISRRRRHCQSCGAPGRWCHENRHRQPLERATFLSPTGTTQEALER